MKSFSKLYYVTVILIYFVLLQSSRCRPTKIENSAYEKMLQTLNDKLLTQSQLPIPKSKFKEYGFNSHQTSNTLKNTIVLRSIANGNVETLLVTIPSNNNWQIKIHS